ncbi:OLC1v1028435C1 [Oldenlandia corymbosa var. corymbosa]|uniref:OLC1v1028435C1 n=1 Tax=Oldenlandia corymbosa var. corymbosa TaxID=529605 RepID=A0AAV1CBP6_OLDCO|nr:OLC1v1028435C1 [Oldenlandia corymbosa var. corymbosa]
MMLHAIPIPNSSNPFPQINSNSIFLPSKSHDSFFTAVCRASASSQNPLFLTNYASSSASSPPPLPLPLRYVSNTSYPYDENQDVKREEAEFTDDGGGGEVDEEYMVESASAVAALIRKVSTSPVEFVHRIENAGGGGGGDGGGTGLVLPSVDFRRLCLEQLNLFRRIVHPDAILSVYVRPAGSYVMDQLELRRTTVYPSVDNAADIVILVGNFRITAGLRTVEAALSSGHAEFFPELGSVVFPLVKHPFVVGFLVAELPRMTSGRVEPEPSPAQSSLPPPICDSKFLELQTGNGKTIEMFNLTSDQILNAVNISHSLAMAYVMDQKATLLQQSSWQNNVRMSSLVEQIRGSLSSIRTLSKMLSVQVKRSEIAFDLAEDILVQGDHMQDIIQQLQDAAYLTKANIIRNNGGNLKKIQEQSHGQPTSRLQNLQPYKAVSLTSATKDSEISMPPLALAPLQQKTIRNPCNVSDVLNDLVGAVEPLALMQQRSLEVSELSKPSQVAVEEPALRQALSNLIEGALLRTETGGSVEIVSTGAPAGGALIIIDDDGPDMQYMTQMHSLTPFGTDLFSENKIEDNMTWNFVAGLTVAREILESYGCVVRVISPRISDGGGSGGARGTRIELWLPYYTSGATASMWKVLKGCATWDHLKIGFCVSGQIYRIGLCFTEFWCLLKSSTCMNGNCGIASGLKKGNLVRSLALKKPNETMRIFVAAFFGVLLGIIIGITVPTLSSTKLNISSSIICDFTNAGNEIKSNSSQISEDTSSLTVVSENQSQNKSELLKVWVPSNPRGAEKLPPHFVANESDLFPRRLWGKPSEDLTHIPKYLVAFTVGVKQKHNIDTAVKKFSENFTILLFHYDGKTSEWDEFEWSKKAIHVSARKQTKWWYAKRFLHPSIVAPYDYIFIWDEDLGLEHFNAEEYIRLVKKHDLEISQPGLDPSRGTTWEMTKRRPGHEVHKNTTEKPGWCSDPIRPPCAAFVEIMAPVFSRDAWLCVWHLIQNDLVHGWGLDFALRNCVEPAHEKIGVVDAQWIVHQSIPSLGNQGQSKDGKAPWQGVRERCRREWTMFQTRFSNAEKAYYMEKGIDPSNITNHRIRT